MEPDGADVRMDSPTADRMGRRSFDEAFQKTENDSVYAAFAGGCPELLCCPRSEG
jgi:hypothetical protein